MHMKATIATAVKDIPLNKLKPSPANVRKTGADVGLEEFAASIAAHGLIQPLVVEPEQNGEGGETGCYLVTAGERRRKALRILVKQKRIKRTEPIPCLVKTDGIASEISLAENVIRTNMHPADQFEAFQKLNEQEGLGTEEIAARFSITPAVVKQRLKLAALSPALMTRYREGELTLDQLMAFTLTDDHGRQHEVWAQLSWNKSPEMIRKLLTQSHVGPSDRRVRFVGAEAYEAAGGTILRDLFVEDHGGYFTDSELLDRLVLEKLEAAAGEVMREGWKWVEVYSEYPYTYTQAMRRTYPQSMHLSEEESAKLDELVTRHDALSAEHGEDAPDDVAAELDTLAEQVASIQRSSEAYLPEDLSRAGAIVSLNPEGTLRVERGLIKPEDQPLPSPSDQADSPGDCGPMPGPTENTTVPDGTNGAGLENSKPLSNQLIENLTAHRTMALQECLAGKPETALMAVVHALALRIFYRQEVRANTCLGLEAKVAEPSTLAPAIHESPAGQSLARRHEDWARRLPTARAELWSWIVGQDAETLLALLAYGAARTIDAVHRSWERGSRHADALALIVGLDMAQWWAPTRESYFAHVSKSHILEAVREGVSEKDADSLAGLKKDAMIEHAERLLAGKRWLPRVLRGDSGTAA
jgi:ParB family transcriptional regulator, chromosome partitioning protein